MISATSTMEDIITITGHRGNLVSLQTGGGSQRVSAFNPQGTTTSGIASWWGPELDRTRNWMVEIPCLVQGHWRNELSCHDRLSARNKRKKLGVVRLLIGQDQVLTPPATNVGNKGRSI